MNNQEEYLAKITELNEQLSQKENMITSLNNQLADAKLAASDYEKRIDSLQKANLDLFLKVPCNNQNETDEKPTKGSDPKSRTRRGSDNVNWSDLVNRIK